MNTDDYRNAPDGIGPQAAEWKDKPHRLVYDLCSRVELVESYLCAIAFDNGIESGDALRIVNDGVDREGFVNMDFHVAAVGNHLVNALDGALRGLVAGLDDVYDGLEEHQAQRARMVKP